MAGLLPQLSPIQWSLGIGAAVLVGFSKTGMPGAGILVVPLLAAIFGGRASVGTMLPMLLLGDCFAVAWYRKHTRWDKLWGLFPWVSVGVGAGSLLLWQLGAQKNQKDQLNLWIGLLVLLMLAVHLARARFGDRISLKSRLGTAGTGAVAGFSTTVSNAAGPVMGIYLTGLELPKEQFMGTTAWYFFIVNAAKVPIYAVVSVLTPAKPIFSSSTFAFDFIMCPLILAGVYGGRKLLPVIPQKSFDSIVLVLAAVAALKLVMG